MPRLSPRMRLPFSIQPNVTSSNISSAALAINASKPISKSTPLLVSSSSSSSSSSILSSLPIRSNFSIISPKPYSFISSSSLIKLYKPNSILSSISTIPKPSSSSLSLFGSMGSIRCLNYGTTYQPSQRKRKRKYGFLARLKGGRLGQAVLARRRMKGRRFLSH